MPGFTQNFDTGLIVVQILFKGVWSVLIMDDFSTKGQRIKINFTRFRLELITEQFSYTISSNCPTISYNSKTATPVLMILYLYTFLLRNLSDLHFCAPVHQPFGLLWLSMVFGHTLLVSLQHIFMIILLFGAKTNHKNYIS